MRPVFRLALSVAAGIAAALLIGLYVTSISARADQERDKAMREYGGKLTRVLVAARDIKAGSRLTSGTYEQRTWLSALLPDDAIREAAQLEGARASSNIYAGEPILRNRLERKSQGGLDVPAGLVAVSVPVEAELAVGGDVHSGDRVSVVVYDGSDGARRLADDVLVLATNSDADGAAAGGIFSAGNGTSDPTWVTLAVAPRMELPLVNVSESGRIHLTVHGEGSGAVETSTATGDFSDLRD